METNKSILNSTIIEDEIIKKIKLKNEEKFLED